MRNPEKAHKWICEGRTYLFAKSNDTKDPKNYRPVTCLSITYKLLTSVLGDRTWVTPGVKRSLSTRTKRM